MKPASSPPWFSRVQTGVSKARDRDVATEHLLNDVNTPPDRAGLSGDVSVF